jgi:hypothetical protein
VPTELEGSQRYPWKPLPETWANVPKSVALSGNRLRTAAGARETLKAQRAAPYEYRLMCPRCGKPAVLFRLGGPKGFELDDLRDLDQFVLMYDAQVEYWWLEQWWESVRRAVLAAMCASGDVEKRQSSLRVTCRARRQGSTCGRQQSFTSDRVMRAFWRAVQANRGRRYATLPINDIVDDAPRPARSQVRLLGA